MSESAPWPLSIYRRLTGAHGKSYVGYFFEAGKMLPIIFEGDTPTEVANRANTWWIEEDQKAKRREINLEQRRLNAAAARKKRKLVESSHV